MTRNSEPLTRRQPFKGLYIAYLLTSVVFVRVPWWCIRYLPRRNRPSPSWSLSRCLIVAAHREVLTKIPIPLGFKATHEPPKPDEDMKDARFVQIEGLELTSGVINGEIRRAMEANGVQPAPGCAYWIFKKGSTPPEDLKAEKGERVALHIHGGAFHLGSAHPDAQTSSLSHGLLVHARTLRRVLAVEYRLSAASPDPAANPFPTAVLDTLAAYQYLVKKLGFEPSNITIVGDSAGGNIAFSVVRHLVETALPDLPPPGGLISCSSWLDLTESHRGPDSSWLRNRQNDILGMGPEYPRAAYMGPLDPREAETNRYISPLSPHFDGAEGMFKGFPRTYISAGGLEVLLDDSTRAAEKLKADGVDVVYEVAPTAIHDYTIFSWHEPERTEGLKKMGEWLNE